MLPMSALASLGIESKPEEVAGSSAPLAFVLFFLAPCVKIPSLLQSAFKGSYRFLRPFFKGILSFFKAFLQEIPILF